MIFPPKNNPIFIILAIITFILELILAGLNRDEAISRASRHFGLPEDEIRRFF
jgi:hypothetical protein